uniref:Uncharacterized protein n=1 Tax=Cacopsylla melanoneura TaxID=428564 RepID=A0A8D9BUF2_9HEMI
MLYAILYAMLYLLYAVVPTLVVTMLYAHGHTDNIVYLSFFGKIATFRLQMCYHVNTVDPTPVKFNVKVNYFLIDNLQQWRSVLTRGIPEVGGSNPTRME